MFFVDRLPLARAVWKSHHAVPRRDASIGRMFPAASSSAGPLASLAHGRLPHGMAALAPETRAALAAVGEFARNRFVELQMAVEPRLVAQVHAADYQTCLRHLLLGAIGRAASGVLVTAEHRVDTVEIAVLDDGCAAAGGSPQQPAWEGAIPLGYTLKADYHPDSGTTVVLRLPLPDRSEFALDDDAIDALTTRTAG
jgi:hypothetical protein